MITLERIFSREKSFFYFQLWNDSDRLGYARFLDYQVKNNAFIILPPGQKGSVWYDPAEMKQVIEQIKKYLIPNEVVISDLKSTLDEHWPFLLPYLKKEKEVESGEELSEYYEHLLGWWSAFTAVFFLPDLLEAPKEFNEYLLKYRAESEKYTEQMNKVFVNAWNKLMPQHADLTHFISPYEAVKMLCNDPDSKKIASEVGLRIDGFGMLNEKIYANINEFNAALSKAGLAIDNGDVKDVKVVKGTVSYRNKEKMKIQGKARVIVSFADMPSFQDGEILITEMTNPDYVPIMRKAGAVITDEGGMTCHASIASRELQVSCIVGTKIASKAFKTGDMLEVDMEKGIVRILK